MSDDPEKSADHTTLDATVIELAIRLLLLALLIFWSIVIIRPFIAVIIWSTILAVALYPIFDRLSILIGGRRKLAAAIVTTVCLLILIGPVTWLGLSLAEALWKIVAALEAGTNFIPQPFESVRKWPLIGEQIFQIWELAATNLKAAMVKILPQLRPYGSALLGAAGSAGAGILQLFVSVIIAGFMLAPGPMLVGILITFLRRFVSERGEAFVQLAGATIRAVSQGVIGISLAQALLAGIGLIVAGVPAAGLISFLVLLFGIAQIGPSLILIPIIVWSWFAMETSASMMFTAYMVPVNLLDNILKPIFMARGLPTPIIVIFIGVIGGALAHGLLGLFVGPIVLAVAWDLLRSWMQESEMTSAHD